MAVMRSIGVDFRMQRIHGLTRLYFRMTASRTSGPRPSSYSFKTPTLSQANDNDITSIKSLSAQNASGSIT